MSQWRLSDWTLGVLVSLIVLAIWESILINNQPVTRGCGGDFAQYYIAGTILSRGEQGRLYDQTYFQHCQESLRGDPLPSLYPPTLGMLVMPLTRLPYQQALAVWWAIQAICLVAVGVIFYRTSNLETPWRINMLAALAAMTPLWLAVGIAQLGPMILLVVAGGLTLHKRGRFAWAGILLSLLALKPQLAAGLVLWMLLRRDFRTLLGLAGGFAMQALVVAALFGPGLWLDYLHAMPAISAMTRRAHFSPMMEASFVGTASNLLWEAGLSAYEKIGMKIAYALSVSAAAVMLCQVVFARRPLFAPVSDLRHPTSDLRSPETANYEYACGVLFMMILPPYFILYDHTLMAIPLVMLWTSPGWRFGVCAFATTTVLVVNLSLISGLSLAGPVALATMFYLMHCTNRLACNRLAASVRDFSKNLGKNSPAVLTS